MTSGQGHDRDAATFSRRGVLAAAGLGTVAALTGADRADAASTPWPVIDWSTVPGATEIGRSTQDRPIHVVRRTGAAATVTVLVVGVVHGNEPIGAAVAQRLLGDQIVLPDWLDLHVVPVANPDGYAGKRRANGARIDLNRDGRVLWKKKPRDGGPTGPGPESQPETQIVLGYARSMPTPALSIWVHQRLGYVAPVGVRGSSPVVARVAGEAYRKAARLARHRYVAQSGGWETTAAYDVGPAILVEGVKLRWPTALELDRHTAAFLAAVDTLPH